MTKATETKAVKGKETVKETKPKTQTDVIREMIKGKTKREELVKKLAETFKKEEAWAKARIKLYENHYGEMGKEDKNLKG